MFSVSRASRACLFCKQYTSRFYASSTNKGKSKLVTTSKKAPIGNPQGPVSSVEEEGVPKKDYKSRIESFLEELDASSKPPGLDDLKALQPSQPSGPGSSTYSQEYNDAVKKRALVRILMEKSWGWVPPEVIKREKAHQQDMEIR
ncbi:2183_t:CDS:2, partial [Acaulospora colombiana]